MSEPGAGFEEQIEIAEAFLTPFGSAVRDAVMADNALRFYERIAASG